MKVYYSTKHTVANAALIIGLAVYYYIYLGAKSIDYHSVLFSS